MQSFNLKIITAEGVKFDGQAEGVLVRSVNGNVSIWANHIDYVTALGIGKAVVTTANGEKRTAACCGGVLSVIKNEVTMLASTFEWKEEIDLERAEKALEEAKKKVSAASDKKAEQQAKNKVKRAMTRIEVKKG